MKASVRAKVEHAFHVVKNLFRHRKVRYKGLAKNQAHLFSLFGLANLFGAKWQLLTIQARGASRKRQAARKGDRNMAEAPMARRSSAAARLL